MANEVQQEVEEEDLPSSSSKASQDSPTKDVDVVQTLKSIAEESLQISELSEMEKTYSGEVVTLFRHLIEPLNSTFHIKPTSLSKSDSSIQDVVLTPQGTVCVMHSHGTINSRPLEGFSTEILLRIVSEVVPEAKKILVEKRQKITGRVGTLEKITKEFRKLPAQATASPRQGRASKGQMPLNQDAAQRPEIAEASNTAQPDALKAALLNSAR